MRELLIIGFMLFRTLQFENVKYSIDIFDSNYSMAYTLQYHLANDSISVTMLSGIKGKKPMVLEKKRIPHETQTHIVTLITSGAFKKLKNEYKNLLIMDGDQKAIEIQVNGDTKKIKIENVYNIEIAMLFDKVNPLLNKKLKIKYSKAQ